MCCQLCTTPRLNVRIIVNTVVLCHWSYSAMIGGADWIRTSNPTSVVRACSMRCAAAMLSLRQ